MTTDNDKSTIDFGRAFAFVADDPRWLWKLLLIAVFSGVAFVLIIGPLTLFTLSIIPEQTFADLAEIDPRLEDLRVELTPGQRYQLLLPVASGLLLTALLLGYYIQLVANTRAGQMHPLPNWDAWTRKLVDGLTMQTAYALYLLSAAVFYGVGIVLVRLIGGLNAELIQVVLGLCILFPLLLVYLLGVIFVTSINVLPYSQSRRFTDFFQVGWAWRRLRQDTGLTFKWFLFGFTANFGFSVVQALPVVQILGYLLSFFMTVPVQGHLLGQYGAALDERHGDALAA